MDRQSPRRSSRASTSPQATCERIGGSYVLLSLGAGCYLPAPLPVHPGSVIVRGTTGFAVPAPVKPFKVIVRETTPVDTPAPVKPASVIVRVPKLPFTVVKGPLAGVVDVAIVVPMTETAGPPVLAGVPLVNCHLHEAAPPGLP